MSLPSNAPSCARRRRHENGSSFGLFRIWVLCLLGLGFHLNAASGKVSWTKAMVVVFGLYLGWALAAAAVLAALS